MKVRLIIDGDEAKTIILEKEVAMPVTGLLGHLGHKVERKIIIWREEAGENAAHRSTASSRGWSDFSRYR
jgi:hypothetical protein